MDRKYKQRGYADRDSQDKKEKERSGPAASRVLNKMQWGRARLGWSAP